MIDYEALICSVVVVTIMSLVFVQCYDIVMWLINHVRII